MRCHRINDGSDLLSGRRLIIEVQYGTVFSGIEFENEIVVVRDDESVSFDGIRADIRVGRPFPELRHRVYVFTIVAQPFQTVHDLVFDILVEEQTIRVAHASWRTLLVRGRIQCRATCGLGGGLLVALLHSTHFLGVVVIVGERRIDVGEIEVVPIGDSFRSEPLLLDACLDDADGNPRPLDMWLVMNRGLLARDDAMDALGGHSHPDYPSDEVKCFTTPTSASITEPSMVELP